MLLSLAIIILIGLSVAAIVGRIPQMILAGASCDDIFVIVLFSTFVTMSQGGSAKMTDFLNIPVSIVRGVLLGAIAGVVSIFYLKRHINITS